VSQTEAPVLCLAHRALAGLGLEFRSLAGHPIRGHRIALFSARLRGSLFPARLCKPPQGSEFPLHSGQHLGTLTAFQQMKLNSGKFSLIKDGQILSNQIQEIRVTNGRMHGQNGTFRYKNQCLAQKQLSPSTTFENRRTAAVPFRSLAELGHPQASARLRKVPGNSTRISFRIRHSKHFPRCRAYSLSWVGERAG
jgi:hypothetical protein